MSKFEKAIEQFDQLNSQDPNKETFNGQEYPKELLYAMRMTEFLSKMDSSAPEVLQLAARSQHLCRWEIPRKDYPMDRVGYLKWRTRLKDFHAERAGEVLREVGYEDETIHVVQKLIRKESLQSDPVVQTLEDVVCLVFLEHYLASFSTEHDEDKVVDILQKTWKKMSKKAQQVALELNLSEAAKHLVQKALS